MKRILFIVAILLSARGGAQTPSLAIADSLYAVGNYSAAIQVLEEFPIDSEAALLRLAKAHQAQGELGEAKAYYEQVLEQNPQRVVTAVDYGKITMRLEELSIADSVFLHLTKEYPETANFHYQLGLVREKQQKGTGLPDFFKTIDLDPGHRNSLIKLCNWALSNKKFFMAITLGLQGNEAYPNDDAFLSVLSQAYYGSKQYEKAIPSFTKLLELGKGSENVHTRLALSYYRTEQIDKAIEHYEKALEYEDRSSSTHFSLGQLYYRKREWEKSELHFLTAILMKKQLLDKEYLSLALTYKEMEDYKKASKYIARALEENPENERALFERAIIADHYIKDNREKLDYYNEYLKQFETLGSEHLISLAKRRVKDLKEEIHFR